MSETRPENPPADPPAPGQPAEDPAAARPAGDPAAAQPAELPAAGQPAEVPAPGQPAGETAPGDLAEMPAAGELAGDPAASELAEPPAPGGPAQQPGPGESAEVPAMGEPAGDLAAGQSAEPPAPGDPAEPPPFGDPAEVSAAGQPADGAAPGQPAPDPPEAAGAHLSAWFDCADPVQRAEGIAKAAAAVLRGELVVLPTDTVYGIGADAFRPEAVASLLAAKGRGRDAPPPVLVGSARTAAALVEDLGPFGQALIDEFWPGGLTLVCRASRSLAWDLGETKGTVAIRMPDNQIALDLLAETGPMAVSSANLTGQPPAVAAAGARDQLGDSVAVYLDGGDCGEAVPSTIVDLTAGMPRLLRAGAVPIGRLREVAAVAMND